VSNPITSLGYDDRLYTLVVKGTTIPTFVGAKVVSFRDTTYKLEGGRAPHKPGSEGKVWVGRFGSAAQSEFYPSVFNLAWVVLP
jgi:hypothetical protein